LQAQIQTETMLVAMLPSQAANANKLAAALGVSRNALFGILVDNIKPEQVSFDRAALPRRGWRKASAKQLQTETMLVAMLPSQAANANKLAAALGVSRNALFGILVDNIKPEQVSFDRAALPRRGRRKASAKQQ